MSTPSLPSLSALSVSSGGSYPPSLTALLARLAEDSKVLPVVHTMLTFGRGLSPRAEAFRRATEQRKVIALRPWGEMEGARCGSSQGTAAWAGLKRLLIRTDRQDAGKSGIGKDKMPFSACGSQLRWATSAPTEFASRRPAGARSPLLPPGTTPSTTVTILPDARGKRLYPPLSFGELRRYSSRAVPMLMVRADQRELVRPCPSKGCRPNPVQDAVRQIPIADA